MRRVLLLVPFLFALACDGAADDETGGAVAAPDASASATGPTFHRDVKPILEARCASCHKAGGIAPFSVDSPETVRGWETAMAHAVESRRMPPWPPDLQCRRYQHERVLDEAEIETIRGWAAGGAPTGDPADAPPAGRALTRDEIGPPSFTGGLPVAYTPDRTLPDDYRCFVVDPALDEDRWVRAVDVHPDNESTVHHIVLFVIPPEERDTLEALDAAHPGAGYPCFGGPGVPGGAALNTLTAWAPGSQRMDFPADAGIRVRAGSLIAMQVHYNTHGFDGTADQSRIDLYYHAERPARDVLMNPMGNFSLRIPAGDPAYTQDVVVRNTTGVGMTLLAVLPHMHTKGTRIRVSVERADGADDCLVDIPRWDFHWQGGYHFRPGEEVRIGPEDRIRLSCTYDNAGAGAEMVTWGEGTSDEMCLAYLTVIRDAPLPEVPPPAERPERLDGSRTCDGLDECVVQCDDIGCEQQCVRRQSPGCQECYFTGTFACGHALCTDQTAALTGCTLGCMVAGEGFDVCPLTYCLREYLAYSECITPHRAAGACNDTLARCEVAF